ncbi:MAG TPA: NHL repeat-containing protein [Candidatus Elarobacter sp.]|nr:NHL repeat-containing protein [Candidatus Elarobacter sp.]
MLLLVGAFVAGCSGGSTSPPALFTGTAVTPTPSPTPTPAPNSASGTLTTSLTLSTAVTLGPIGPGDMGTVSCTPASAATTLAVVFSLTQPAGTPTVQSMHRRPLNIGGANIVPFGYFTVTPNATVTCPNTPSFAMTFPSSATIPAAANAYAAIYDPGNAGAGWNTIAGTAAVSGSTLIWTTSGVPISLVAGRTYAVVLFTTSSTLAVPTPTPTPTPSPTPSPTPTPVSLYVPNASSVIAFPIGASGNVAPSNTVSGAATTLSNPTAEAFDTSRTLYVADFNTNAIDEFSAGASGNTAPAVQITGAATGISGPEGIGVDSSGNIYLSNRNGSSVTVYNAGSAGNAAPARTISGALTMVNAPQQLVVNPGGDFYVANGVGSTVTYFAAGANGNVAPTRTLNISLGSFPLGLAVDSSGNIYVATTTAIGVYAPGSSGAAAPTRTITGASTGLQFIEGIAVDSAGNIYADDCNQHAVLVFGPAANGNVPPERTISGSSTTLGCPLKPAIL